MKVLLVVRIALSGHVVELAVSRQFIVLGMAIEKR
jgi:hypothetical protein